MLEKYQSIQPIAYKIVTNTLNCEHFAHAYLVETNNYESGLSFSLDFAKAILCPNYNKGQPICSNCIQCKMIDDNNFPELKIIQPDGTWIKKEQLIDLQEEFNKKSIIGNKKIYIINKADRLNVNSSNTLLKFLEEPQEGIIAILVTSNKYQLIDTIVSRCQVISLNGQSGIESEVSTNCKIAKILTDNEKDYYYLVNGSLSLEIDTVINFIKYYEQYNKKILLYMNEYWFKVIKEKDIISRAILLLLFFYKDVLNYKVMSKIEIFTDYIKEIKDISEKNTISKLLKKITIINENRQYVDSNANLSLLMDRMIIKMEEGV